MNYNNNMQIVNIFQVFGIFCSLYVSCCSKSRDDGEYYLTKII